MGQAYKEMARIILAGMVMVALLAFVAGSVLLPGLGERMDVPGAEYATYQDFAQTMDVCGREAPEGRRRNFYFTGVFRHGCGRKCSGCQGSGPLG